MRYLAEPDAQERLRLEARHRARRGAPSPLHFAAMVEARAEGLLDAADCPELSVDARAVLFALGQEFHRLAEDLRAYQPALGAFRRVAA